MISLNDIEERKMPKKMMEVLTESMFYVLMSFKSGDMCGIDIVKFIEKQTSSRILIGPATLYTILGKFEKEKYIKEVDVDGRKRTYAITEKGEVAYQNELARLKQCVLDAQSEAVNEE